MIIVPTSAGPAILIEARFFDWILPLRSALCFRAADRCLLREPPEESPSTKNISDSAYRSWQSASF